MKKITKRTILATSFMIGLLATYMYIPREKAPNTEVSLLPRFVEPTEEPEETSTPEPTVVPEPQEGEEAELVAGNTGKAEISKPTTAKAGNVGGGKSAAQSEQVQAEQKSSTGAGHTGMKVEAQKEVVTVTPVAPEATPAATPEATPVTTPTPTATPAPTPIPTPEVVVSTPEPTPSSTPEPSVTPVVPETTPEPTNPPLDYSDVGDKLEDPEQGSCPVGFVYNPISGHCAH